MNKISVSLRALIYGGVATKVKDSFLGMQIIIGFSILHSAGNYIVGFLSIIALLANMMQAVSAYLLEKGFSAKKASLFCSFSTIPVYLLLVFLPLFENNELLLTLLCLCLILGFSIGGICGGIWLPWVKVLVPKRIMRHFLAVRFKNMMVAQFLCLGISYVVLRFITNQNMAYMVLFFLAFVAICCNAVSYLFVEDGPIKYQKTNHFYLKFGNILKDVRFLKILAVLSSVDFIQYYFMPFITVFLLKFIGFTMEMVIVFTAIQYAAYIFWVMRWEKMGRCLKILQYAAVMEGLTAGLYILAVSINFSSFMVYAVILLSSLIWGAALAGFQLASQHAVILAAPENDAPAFMAVCNCVRAVVTALAAFCGGFALTLFETEAVVISSAWIFFFISVCLLVLLCYLSVKGIARCIMVEQC